MSKVQKTIKVSPDVYEAAEDWLEQAGHVLNFSTLVEAAIKKYITEVQEFEPVRLSKKQAVELATKALKKHKKAIDRLK